MVEGIQREQDATLRFKGPLDPSLLFWDGDAEGRVGGACHFPSRRLTGSRRTSHTQDRTR